MGQINIAQYVYIMNKDGKAPVKQHLCLFYTSPRIEQAAGFVADTNIHIKIMVLLKIRNDLACKVVNVHHNALKTCIAQAKYNMFQQRFSPHSYQGLGHCISKGL